MDVIVIVIDALRARDVGCFGRDDDTTPNIDALASESMVFERAYSLSNYTDVCMSSIMSGKAPREHGVTHHGTAHTEENLERIEDRSPKFLPEILQDNGYHTIGVDWMGRWHGWGYDEYGIEQESSVTETPSLPKQMSEWLKQRATNLPDPLLFPIAKQYYRRFGYDDGRVNCEELTDMAIERMDRIEQPSFTLLHYWDVHPPYLPPEEYKSRFSYDGEDEPLSRYFGLDAKGPMSAEYQPYATGEHRTMAESKEAYDGAISWVDAQLGRLFDHLREQEKLEETMVVVTADHGHNFGEHGIFSDNCSLYDTSIRVPLVVHDPRHDGDRYDGLVQHTDLVPTILDFADIDIPADLRGNVLPESREYAFAEAIEQRMQAIVTDSWKLIVPSDLEYLRKQNWYRADGEVELYDLAADPEETTNVATENPHVVERLTELLDEELAAQETNRGGTRRNVSIKGTDMDDVKSRLSALGYADDDNV